MSLVRISLPLLHGHIKKKCSYTQFHCMCDMCYNLIDADIAFDGFMNKKLDTSLIQESIFNLCIS